jgi:ribosomal protein S18 acetylase RimI-like enzyme
MISIMPLGETTFDDLYTAFSKAFQDYDRTWNRDELAKMLQRRGYVGALSYGAFHDGILVSFTLNGIGIFEGKQTAYDAGTGTLKEYRAKGLATQIFQESIPFLKQKGIEQYLLEVLQHNTKAVSVYTKLGFRVNRELNYFLQSMDKMNVEKRNLGYEAELREIGLDETEKLKEMWDFGPSWQNNFDSLHRAINEFKIIGAFIDNGLAGYGLIEPDSGDIPQIAVSKPYRKKYLGSAILHHLLQYNKSNVVKLLNAVPGCTHFTTFAEKNGIPKLGAQYEMIMDLQ